MSSVMNIPAIDEAESLLQEAETMNPGLWIGHSRTAAFCARAIAEHCVNYSLRSASTGSSLAARFAG